MNLFQHFQKVILCETDDVPGSNVQYILSCCLKGLKVCWRISEVEKLVWKDWYDGPYDPMPIDATDMMMVVLKDKKEWTSAIRMKELEEKWPKSWKLLFPG